MHKYPLRRLAAACLFIIGTLPVQAGTPSTSSGRISVAQVMAMLDESLSNTVAAQVLQAYLGGVGETAGVLVSATDPKGQHYVNGARSLQLDAQTVRSTLKTAVPNKANWAEAPATPLLVNALVTRAGCH